MDKLKIIISGGGTGGHIFPAISIAGEFKTRFPDCEILFVGAKARMEMDKVPQAGYRIIGLPVMGFPRKPGFNTFLFVIRLFQSMIKARRIVKSFQPDIAIGVGGYASGPLLRAAIARKIPALIQEQNSFAGKTNKWLAKKAGCICVAYEGMNRFFPEDKLIITGNPVRSNLFTEVHAREEALTWFNLPGKGKTLLITGGSLGARSINNAVLHNLERFRESGLSLIWQTGSFYYDEMVEKTKGNLSDSIQILQFIDRMDLAYAAADVIVARAGAGTISELCLVGKPVILVPSPNVAEDHQTKNALSLVEKGAAVLIRDFEIEAKLFTEISSLFNSPRSMSDLSENIRSMARPDATSRIVDEALKLIKK
jgi:UDP-N-acetylglucosamine--N-acetylmuramyl-(pentapeptide) pyrophosphoryl-undecaprenol N-acetylglucosamine transferase